MHGSTRGYRQRKGWPNLLGKIGLSLVCVVASLFLTRPAVAQSDCGSKSAARPGQVAPIPTTNQDDPAPSWVCEAPYVSAGMLWKGSRVECVFKILNDGDADLRIKAKGG